MSILVLNVFIRLEIFKQLFTILCMDLRALHALEEVRNRIFSVGSWFSWTRVYKKELWENIRFPQGVFYEDLMTIPHIYLKDLNVYFIDQPLVGYRLNPNSITALHTRAALEGYLCILYVIVQT